MIILIVLEFAPLFMKLRYTTVITVHWPIMYGDFISGGEKEILASKEEII